MRTRGGMKLKIRREGGERGRKKESEERRRERIEMINRKKV